MTSITIRNIPDEVMEKLRERAKNERRSLNNEVIKILEDFTSNTPPSKEQLNSFFKENSFDEDFLTGVEEAFASRSIGRTDITLD